VPRESSRGIYIFGPMKDGALMYWLRGVVMFIMANQREYKGAGGMRKAGNGEELARVAKASSDLETHL